MLKQVALSLTLLVDVLSLVGLITALRRRAAPLPFIGLPVSYTHLGQKWGAKENYDLMRNTSGQKIKKMAGALAAYLQDAD